MSDKFQNKYRIASARLPRWNYGHQAAYFVTICTKNRRHWFGAIRGGTMHLSEIGKIAEQEWVKTPGIRPDMNLELGEFVVMPNHFHAIVIIGENTYNTQPRRDATHRVSTPTPIPPPPSRIIKNPQINSARNPTIWRPLCGDSNRRSPKTPVTFKPISPGNRGITITSFGTTRRFTTFPDISGKTLRNGGKTGSTKRRSDHSRQIKWGNTIFFVAPVTNCAKPALTR